MSNSILPPTFLLCAGASTAPSDAGGAAPPATTLPPKVIQLAESNSKSPNKLGDKYLDGKSGGMYGIGGGEPHAKYFKNSMKKIPRCCAASR